MTKKGMMKNMYDSVIIGSGPAGLTAAIYLSRAGLKNIIINGMEPGGQLTTTTEVENFPGFPQGISGPQLIEDIKAQSKNFGTEFLQAVVKDIESIENNGKKTFKLHLDNGNIIEAKTIILSTGASAKYLGIENEKENIGRGVSACATCDGFFYRGKDVVVIGGGDTAMEEAVFLTKFASKVTVIHRRDMLRASAIMQKRAKDNNKIEWKLDYTPKKVLADEKVTGIELINNKTGETETLTADGIFVAIGRTPNTKFLEGKVEIDERGYIVTKGKSSKTSTSGIFAAGDVQDGRYQQAIIAAGSGAIAGLDVEEYLRENDNATIRFHDGKAFQVNAPNFVELEVVETEPGVKGDSATGANKPAKVETGAVITVPLFINNGDKIKIDTRTNEYLSRV